MKKIYALTLKGTNKTVSFEDESVAAELLEQSVDGYTSITVFESSAELGKYVAEGATFEHVKAYGDEAVDVLQEALEPLRWALADDDYRKLHKRLNVLFDIIEKAKIRQEREGECGYTDEQQKKIISLFARRARTMQGDSIGRMIADMLSVTVDTLKPALSPSLHFWLMDRFTMLLDKIPGDVCDRRLS